MNEGTQCIGLNTIDVHLILHLAEIRLHHQQIPTSLLMR